jgi:hypothetical protein
VADGWLSQVDPVEPLARLRGYLTEASRASGVIAPFPKSYAACCPRCAPFVISPWGAGWGFEAKDL